MIWGRVEGLQGGTYFWIDNLAGVLNSKPTFRGGSKKHFL